MKLKNKTYYYVWHKEKASDPIDSDWPYRIGYVYEFTPVGQDGKKQKPKQMICIDEWDVYEVAKYDMALIIGPVPNPFTLYKIEIK